MSERLLWLDVLRGLAIVLMVIFHFCYDLRYFGYVDWHIPNGSGWWQFRYIIVSTFVFTVGVSLSLAHAKKINKKSFNKRLFQLLLAATAITVMSLFLFPKAWIYFGILHFIAAASAIGIIFVRQAKLALGIGVLILLSYWLGISNSEWPFVWFSQWLPKHTEDFVPLFPWLGVMFIGLGIGSIFPLNKIRLSKNTITQKMAFMGKHGLVIYLVHQPILFAGFYLIGFFR